jgi:hypothetical protein
MLKKGIPCKPNNKNRDAELRVHKKNCRDTVESMERNSTNSIHWADRLRSLKDTVPAGKTDLIMAIEKLVLFHVVGEHEPQDPSTWRERGRLHENLCYLLVEEAIFHSQSGKQNMIQSTSAVRKEFFHKDASEIQVD